MKYFDIDFLKSPSANKKIGTAMGISALGDSIARLGEIGTDRQKLQMQKEQNNFSNALDLDKFDLYKNNSSKEMSIKLDELKKDRELNNARAGLIKAQTEQIYSAQRQAKEERANNIRLFRQMYPDITKGKSDSEVYQIGLHKEAEYKAYKERNKNAPADMSEINMAQYRDLAEYFPKNVKAGKDGKFYASNFILSRSKEELDRLKAEQDAKDKEQEKRRIDHAQKIEKDSKKSKINLRDLWLDSQIGLQD